VNFSVNLKPSSINSAIVGRRVILYILCSDCFIDWKYIILNPSDSAGVDPSGSAVLGVGLRPLACWI
jgi:hypothetical protein